MSDTKQYDGGPAFGSVISLESGNLTVRDHFAGLAMQGMCSISWPEPCTYPEVSKRAYAMADAMLAARKQ